MPNYQYRIREKIDQEYVDKIIDVKFSMKYVGNEQELPQDILDRISYLDENNNKVIGTKIIGSPSLGGFDNNGTSRNKVVGRQ